MSLKDKILGWTNQQQVQCQKCNHPSNACSGSCQSCLHEVHFWHNNHGLNRRTYYNCRKLIYEYVKSFTERYYQNIKSACDSVDLSEYGSLSILSIGCGATPDLMAFEEMAKDKHIFYRGIDKIEQWADFHKLVEAYAKDKNITVDFQQSDIFNPSAGPQRTEIFNIAIMQFLISSIWSDLAAKGKNRTERENQVRTLFSSFVDTALNRWRCSDSTSPFLIILNDNDSASTGRRQFYDLWDILIEKGYEGKATIRTRYFTEDLNDRKKEGKQGFTSFEVGVGNPLNNSALLTLEVMK